MVSSNTEAETDWQLAPEIIAQAIMLEKLERGSRRSGKNSARQLSIKPVGTAHMIGIGAMPA
jgi:hypothetical protein